MSDYQLFARGENLVCRCNWHYLWRLELMLCSNAS
uniref:Uncharacterized protein n=1 Tax=Anguilla anguilla TaxID=7936 RepID=A0A0E9RD33_ANGAN